MPLSSMYPTPPSTCSPADVAANPASVGHALATGVSRSTITWAAARVMASGLWRARSRWWVARWTSSRPANVDVRMDRSSRRTSGWSAIGDRAGGRTPVARPWYRPSAYRWACWYARSATLGPWMPMVSLAAFIIVNIARMPPCRSPTSSASASSYDMTHVGLPWMPSFSSIPMQCTAFGRPSAPSAPTVNLGTMKSERPFVPPGASGVRARTRWTMLSARSCSPQVMKIFVPDKRQPPPSTGTAWVRTAARSEPASGSVRFIVPVHSPVITRGRNRACWSGEPQAVSSSTALWVRTGLSENARLAELSISWRARPTDAGNPPPPYAAGAVTAPQPAATNCLNAGANDAGVVTLPSAGSKRAPWRSPRRSVGATTSAAKRANSSSTAATVDRSTWSNAGRARTSSIPVMSRASRMSATGGR